MSGIDIGLHKGSPSFYKICEINYLFRRRVAAAFTPATC